MKQNKKLKPFQPLRILAWVICVIGVCVLVYGIYFYIHHHTPLNYKHAQGTVVSITTTDGPTYCYRPVTGKAGCENTDNRLLIATISFTTANKQYSFQESLGGAGENNYHESQKVTVAYNPKNPESRPFDLDNNMNKYVGEIAIIGGAILILASLLILVFKLRS